MSDQGPRYGDPLLLAARELVGAVRPPPRKPDQIQKLVEPLCVFARLLAGDEHGQEHVLLGRERGDEVEELEHEAHPLPPEERELPVREPESSVPPTTTRPDVGLSRAPRMCNSVLFPDPEGPMIAANSPSGNSRETSSSARTSFVPSP